MRMRRASPALAAALPIVYWATTEYFGDALRNSALESSVRSLGFIIYAPSMPFALLFVNQIIADTPIGKAFYFIFPAFSSLAWGSLVYWIGQKIGRLVDRESRSKVA